jgi:hypothetical protein
LERGDEISMDQVAQLARVSVDAARSLLRRNKIQTTRYGSRRVYAKVGDVLALLRARQVR